MNDSPGFYTSRTFGNFVMNGMRITELGVSPWDIYLIALRTGFHQGPLHIYGTTGGNVIFHAANFLVERFPDRVTLPETLVRLHRSGYIGIGKPSFYLDARRMKPDESVLQFVALVNGFPRPSEQEAADILLLGMANEAFWCVTDGALKDYYAMELMRYWE